MAPISAIIASAKSSARDWITSAAAMKLARRSPGPSADQAANARAAASAAAIASVMVAAAASLATRPVSGSIRSKVRPSAAATFPVADHEVDAQHARSLPPGISNQ